MKNIKLFDPVIDEREIKKYTKQILRNLENEVESL